MSLSDYIGSQKISANVSSLTTGNEFYSLLMAAFRFADTDNTEKLREVFPEVYEELRTRYNAPGGAITSTELEWVKNYYNVKGE